MKASKIIIPVLLCAFLVLSWASFFSENNKKEAAFQESMQAAEKSLEKGLYEQAVEHYKSALGYKNNESIYVAIKHAYDLLYAEETTSYVRGLYLADMELATNSFPKNALFWETQIDLYLNTENYDSAYKTVKRALNYGAQSEKLDAIYSELLYMVKVDYKTYYDFKTALNGYITVYDGKAWTVIDETGERVRGNYDKIGIINDEGKGLYVNNIGVRILDRGEIARVKFECEIEDAGYYNESSDLMPVKVEGKWRYIASTGVFLPGEYEVAGSYYNHEAVAHNGKTWVLLDEEGNQTSLDNYEDIKLDVYGCHIQNGVVIAKHNGKYRLYDEEFNQIGDFVADDIDICVDSYIAYKQGNKWGFVDTAGNIVLEPEYLEAKSFANGYAAICNENGLWGFITKEFEVVIECEYLDAFYFNSNETCLVSQEEGSVQLLKYMFE